MPGCCPDGSYGNPPFPGYSWNTKGVVDEVGDMKVYRTGCSNKCIIWCYDIYGFEGGRTRQLCDQLADCGYMVILPDFFHGEWRDVGDEDLACWLTGQSDWYGQRQAEWVETILPYARSHGAEVFGCVGTCWGGYMVMRLSAYGEFKAGVSLHPATTCIAENMLNEKMYEVLDEVGCPQLVLTAGEDHSNEKPGGLADKVWGVMSFGGSCVLRSYPDMMHGWTVRGDMRDQAVNNAATAAFNAMKGFLNTHVM
eukprot:TRINITY_DN19192_c0_g1_i1.p1 TRINITY_DN19192_c0_g1~~TRINITY_DN19192_c0_g1_i1.p1  ORF type:complete len:253 (-),score=69.10 TRINITY_DN19192_c0_g1_i1:79-837(-)